MISVETLLTILGLVVTIVGSIWGIVKWVDSKITRVEERANRRIDEAHHRINELRAESVSKDDLGAHVKRIEEAVAEMRGEFRAVHRRIDELLSAWAKKVSVD